MPHEPKSDKFTQIQQKLLFFLFGATAPTDADSWVITQGILSDLGFM